MAGTIAILMADILLFLAVVEICFYFLLRRDIRTMRFLVFMLLGFILQSSIVISRVLQIQNILTRAVLMPPLSMFTISFYVLFLWEYIGGDLLKPLSVILVLLFPFLELLTFLSVPLGINLNFSYPLVWHEISLVLISVYLLLIVYRLSSTHIGERKKRLWIIIQIVVLLLICVLLGYSLDPAARVGHISGAVYFLFHCVNLLALGSFYFHLFNLYKSKLRNEKTKRINILHPLARISELKRPEMFSEDKSLYDQSMSNLAKSPSGVENMEEIKERIEKFFAENKEIYLGFDFKLNTLSKCTDISRTHLSKFFPYGFSVSFKQYLDKKRIAHACQILSENKEVTTTALADSCGYKSRATFYKQFKIIMGKSITAYRTDLE